MKDNCCGVGVGPIRSNEHQEKFTRNRKTIGFLFYFILFFKGQIKKTNSGLAQFLGNRDDCYYGN